MKVIRELIGDRTPYSVSPDMTDQSVVEYLCDRRVGAVAVCDGDNKAVGVFSERDLLHRVVLPELDTQKVLISEVMTADVVHVNIDDKHSTARNLSLIHI